MQGICWKQSNKLNKQKWIHQGDYLDEVSLFFLDNGIYWDLSGKFLKCKFKFLKLLNFYKLALKAVWMRSVPTALYMRKEPRIIEFNFLNGFSMVRPSISYRLGIVHVI